MQGWQGFHYPAVTKDDLALELYLTSFGRIIYPAMATYPSSGHPLEFQMSWKTGRKLGDFALVWIEEGHGSVETTCLNRTSLVAGTVLLLPPGEWHRYRPDPKSGWSERWICANGSYLHRLRGNGFFPSNPEIRRVPNQKALNAAFDVLQAEGRKNSLWVSALTLSAIALALGETDHNAIEIAEKVGSGDMLVDAVVLYMRSNCHRPLSVNAIAKQAGVSRRMLERRFSQAWPRSIAQELTRVRVHRGRDLLSDKNLSVKEAGYAAGFGSAARFISAHRRLFGNTPGSARNRY